ncbi:uncharacterized protein [Ptychodera flava]|uniref:uncharacterized protein n=1 Tax=Ptychodera flava TaxID=63121 RepID=UPI00396A5601
MLIHEHVGPLQISVVKIVVDILRFLFIFGVIWLAFALGMTQIYLQDVTEGDIHEDDQTYSSLAKSLVLLYWSLYGLTELDTLDTKNDITEKFGIVVFAAYHIIALIILMNLLIALMSTTYERIVENADTEWKFARSEMWMSHLVRGATLPPPFNIVPSPKSVFRIFQCSEDDKKKGQEPVKKKEEKREKKEKGKKKEGGAYKDLCRKLIHRYFSDITTSAREQDDAKEIKLSDIRSVKQDMSTFRFEVYGMMQKMMDRLNGLQLEVGKSNNKNTTVMDQVLQLEAALSKSKLADSEFARAMQSQLTSARSQSDEAMKILERKLSENQEQYRLRTATMGSDMLHELRKCLSSTHIDEEATVFHPETSPVVVETMNLQQAAPSVVDMRESVKMEEPGKESRETEVQTDHSGPIWINQERIERVDHTTAKDTGGKTFYGNSDNDDSDGYIRDVDGEGSLGLLDVEVFKDEERYSREEAISPSGTQDELVLTAADVDSRLETDVSMHTSDESPSLPSEAKGDCSDQNYDVLEERTPSLTDTETSETATSIPKRHSLSFEVPKPVLYRKASNPEDLRVKEKIDAIEKAGHPAAVVDEDATDDNITFEESFIPGLSHDTEF